MTLGKHPQKVSPPWLIPVERFDSEHHIKRFHDVAPALGLDVTGRAGGSVMEDFDKDGLLDYRLREGESRLTVMELKRFSLSGKSGAQPHRHH